MFYFSISNNDKKINCVIPNQIVNNSNNYLYNITYTKDKEVIKLSVKKYNQKYLIEMEKDGIRNFYYINYLNIYEKASNGEYIKYRKQYIIDDLDNNLLLLDYINDLSLRSSISNDKENTCYVNRKDEITICISIDDLIILEGSNYSITYDIKQKNNINDFDVKLSDSNVTDEIK